MFDGEGVLVKCPLSPGGEERPWWLVLMVDDSIGNYYRYWLNYTHRAILKVHRPFWRSHVSVIRGEEPLNKIGWRALKEGRKVNFKYDHFISSDGIHFWLPVYCPELFEIRDFLGIRRSPLIPFHLTIGTRTE